MCGFDSHLRHQIPNILNARVSGRLAERLAKIRALAEEGYSSRQIHKRLGISEKRCRAGVYRDRGGNRPGNRARVFALLNCWALGRNAVRDWSSGDEPGMSAGSETSMSGSIERPRSTILSSSRDR